MKEAPVYIIVLFKLLSFGLNKTYGDLLDTLYIHELQ
jgi:hypothetical protein